MKTDLYVTCATDREQLELLDLLRRRGYRFPGGRPLPGDDLPRRDGRPDRLPWALDTVRREAAHTSAAAVGYLSRLRGLSPAPFSRLDWEAL